jgi:hypothetical protein
MCRYLHGVFAVAILFGPASCYKYVPLGTTPPGNPDYSPPIEARITLTRPVALPADSQRDSKDTVSGEIKDWKEDSILLLVDNCSVDPRCTVEIPISAVSNVEARTSTFSSSAQTDLSVESIVVLVASGAALAFVGWLAYDYFTYDPFENWGRK